VQLAHGWGRGGAAIELLIRVSVDQGLVPCLIVCCLMGEHRGYSLSMIIPINHMSDCGILGLSAIMLLHVESLSRLGAQRR
jgi:hypothetical protein